jgi:acetyltransferase-like isoleucine patch superfamily enzyme
MKFRYRVMEFLSKRLQAYRYYSYRAKGFKNIDRSAILERNLRLDKVYPAGVHIGANTLVASEVTILTHEHVKRDKSDPRAPWITETHIGRNCFIGVGSMILPGVTIGDEVIVGAHSVVTKDVPPKTIVAGNPARIIRQNIKMNDKAILDD